MTNKEKPEKFDEVLNRKYKWEPIKLSPSHWENIDCLGEYGDYYLYFAYDDNDTNGFLYRTKRKKICAKCDREIMTNKEKPEKFEEFLDTYFTWVKADFPPPHWKRFEFLAQIEDYLYWVRDLHKKNRKLYRNKIKEKCLECGREK